MESERQPPGTAAHRGLKIGIIGGGVAGIVTAHLLQEKHDVTLLEANDYLGGHTHTIVIEDGPDEGTAVDTGFIVMNDRTYPLFRKFLERLEVATRPTGMSFSFHDRVSGLVYSGSGFNGLFTQRKNLFDPSFLKMVKGILRFWNDAKEGLAADSIPNMTLGDYLRGRYPSQTIDNYILPMAAAIWSASPSEVHLFPAESFLRFFSNHGLLGVRDRPQWMTVVGGSHSYVKAFQGSFKGRVVLNSPVEKVSRQGEGVAVETARGDDFHFDGIVIASHADDALRMLEDPSEEEKKLLGPWEYQANDTVLHTDTSVLPPHARAWSCWNCCREDGTGDTRPVSVSYSMNILQGLDTSRHYCVSLNRHIPIRNDSVIARMVYRHPYYTFDSVATQKNLRTLNGKRNTWYCGSYFGYGFHEDAVRSAVQVGLDFGIDL
jgi:predicted NAD/FAD-binding protein